MQQLLENFYKAYKTEYHLAGDVTGYTSNGEAQITNGDKIRKVSLGISSQVGFDSDLLKFKGTDSASKTFGFHMSKNAKTITGDTTYQTTSYDLEGTNKGLLETKQYRKFTMAVAGGFDGWDIYRGTRTNGDGYIYGKNTYVSGNTNNGGVFSTSVGNSDYYAYLQAINTFSNPESVDINIFATPGIDFVNHSSLVNNTIEMIEGDRADSLYIINPPNTDTVDEIIDQLDKDAMVIFQSDHSWEMSKISESKYGNRRQIFNLVKNNIQCNLGILHIERMNR